MCVRVCAPTRAHTCTHTHTQTHTFSLRDATIPVEVLTEGAPDGGLGATSKPPPALPVAVLLLSADDSVDGKIGSNAIAGTGLRSPSPSVHYIMYVNMYIQHILSLHFTDGTVYIHMYFCRYS